MSERMRPRREETRAFCDTPLGAKLGKKERSDCGRARFVGRPEKLGTPQGLREGASGASAQCFGLRGVCGASG